MKVVKWANFLKNGIDLKGKMSSVTTGIFDGVHRGHRALIGRIVSHNSGYVPVVITFRQNHKKINNEQRDIQTFKQRLKTLDKLGIQIAIVIDFNEAFKKTPGLDFLNILLERCSIGFFAIGKNFRCGCQLDTDAPAIQRFFASRNIPVEIIPEVTEGSLPISSSRIRAAIAAGDLKLAEAMLMLPSETYHKQS